MGIELGRQIGKETVWSVLLLKRLLIRRFGDLSPEVEYRLEQADPDILLRWGDQVLDAKTIDDVFV